MELEGQINIYFPPFFICLFKIRNENIFFSNSLFATNIDSKFSFFLETKSLKSPEKAQTLLFFIEMFYVFKLFKTVWQKSYLKKH